MEIRYLVHDDKGEGAAKIDKLMHSEGHDAGGKDIVLHVGIPGCPQTLSEVKVDIVL